MHDQRVQFRTTFNVSKSALFQQDHFYNLLINVAGNWIKKQFLGTGKEQHVFRSWLYKGGNLVDPGIRCNIQTNGYCEENRQAAFWVMRLEKRDSQYSQRMWKTDVAFNFLTINEALIAVTSCWSIRTDFLGEDPPIPDVSSPNIVKWIIDSEACKCTTSNRRLSSESINLRVGEGRALWQFLNSEERTIPVVVINMRDWRDVINPDGLQKLLLGSALVYSYNDIAVHQELQHEWGQQKATQYSASPDSIRIYQIELNQSREGDWRRHRFFFLKDYHLRSQELLRLIVQSIFRLNAQKSQPHIIYDIEGMENKIQSERLKGLKDEIANQPTTIAESEYLKALEEENLRLEGEKRVFLSKIAESEEELLFKELALDDLTSKYNQSQQQFVELANDQQHITSGIKEFTKVRQKWSKLPSSLIDVLTLTAALAPDRLLVLDEAMASAKDCDFNLLEDVWSLMMAMIETLHSLHFSPDGGNIEAKFQQETGFSISLKEGAQTKNDGRLMTLRKRIYLNDEIDISAHIKIDRGNKNFRVHYYPDHKKKLLVIGHFGNHLETAGSQRRGER